MLDLEDSCPPAEKVAARKTIIDSIRNLKWQGQTLSIRINDLAGPFALQDILEIIPLVGDRMDTLVVPKIETAAQIHYLDHLLSALNSEVGLELIIESAKALRDAPEIAAASSRVRCLVFGIADYSASINMPLNSISGHGENDGVYPGDPLHFVYSRVIMCGKAEGLKVIDAPYGNFRDLEGLKVGAARSRALGFDGKWCIHPSQIEGVNTAFSPSPDEIERAEKVIIAYQKVLSEGRGAGSIGDSMIDQASLRMAEDVRARAKAAEL
jgi:citrate lyase beta subunit